MTLTRLRALIATTLLCLVSCAQALAQATAKVEMTIFPVELIDLDPDDGITPAMVLIGPAGQYEYSQAYKPLLSVYGRVNGSGLDVEQRRAGYTLGDTSFRSWSDSLNLDIGSTTSSFFAPTEALHGEMVLTSQSETAATPGFVTTNAFSDASIYGRFTLTPNTKATISATILGQALISDTANPSELSARASFGMTVSGEKIGESRRPILAYEYVDLWPNDTLSDTRSVVFSNHGAQMFEGHFYAGVSTDTRSLSPVPEPHAALLGALTLGLATLWRNRPWRRAATSAKVSPAQAFERAA